MEVMGSKSLYCRHPDDVAAIPRHPSRFKKSEGSLARLAEWLGSGLVSNVDADNHAVSGAAQGRPRSGPTAACTGTHPCYAKPNPSSTCTRVLLRSLHAGSQSRVDAGLQGRQRCRLYPSVCAGAMMWCALLAGLHVVWQSAYLAGAH